MSELELLRFRAERKRKEQAERYREMYRYARIKGFTSYEAMALQSRSKEYIDQLVQEAENGEA